MAAAASSSASRRSRGDDSESGELSDLASLKQEIRIASSVLRSSLARLAPDQRPILPESSDNDLPLPDLVRQFMAEAQILSEELLPQLDAAQAQARATASIIEAGINTICEKAPCPHPPPSEVPSSVDDLARGLVNLAERVVAVLHSRVNAAEGQEQSSHLLSIGEGFRSSLQETEKQIQEWIRSVEESNREKEKLSTENEEMIKATSLLNEEHARFSGQLSELQQANKDLIKKGDDLRHYLELAEAKAKEAKKKVKKLQGKLSEMLSEIRVEVKQVHHLAGSPSS